MAELSEVVKKKLEKHYYNAEDPGSFGGAARLSKASGIPLKITKQWLRSQDTYNLHKPVRFKFQRRKVLAFGIGELMQCDLMDMSKFSKFNQGIKFILVAIDVFSKYGYAVPLKNKNADSVLEGFKKLFRKSKFPPLLQTDRGREFENHKLSAYFKRHKIHHYFSNSEYKASVVERFIRTLKSKLYRILTHTHSYKYIHILPSVLKSYNASVHRTTGFAPINVTPDLEPVIFKKMYGYSVGSKYKFEINDRVRISKAKRTFRKGYLPNWTDEVFVIYKRYPSFPNTYLLRDLKGTNVEGRFYEEELQKVIKTSTDFWRVERILKTRGRGKKKEHYVKWYGFDSRFNSWVLDSWLKKRS